MAQALGRAIIRINGSTVDSEPGAKLKLGGAKRKPVMTGYRVHYAEELEQASIECEVPLTTGMSLQAWRDCVGAIVTFQCDTGQSYVVRDAFTEDTLELTGKDGGKIKLKLAGMPAEEMV